MPIGAGAVAGIAAGVSALSSGAQIFASGKMNEKTRDFVTREREQVRREALSDWNMQNSYNSPAQQMQRFKEAGLNPNLIYGQSNSADSIRSTDQAKWNPETPDYKSFGNAAAVGLSAYQDITLQQEQVKNMHQQRTNMELDAALKTLTATSLDQKNQSAAALNPIAISTAAAALEKMQQDTQIASNQEKRTQQLQPEVLEQAILRTLQMQADNTGKQLNNQQIKQQLENLKKDGTLKELDIQLKRLGIQPNDSMIMRMIGQMTSNGDVKAAVKETIKKLKESYPANKSDANGNVIVGDVKDRY